MSEPPPPSDDINIECVCVIIFQSSGMNIIQIIYINTHTHTYLEESFEHDVNDLVLLVDVAELHQVLQGVQLLLPLGLKQTLVWTHTQEKKTHRSTHMDTHSGKENTS